jgi:hypothetical protein
MNDFKLYSTSWSKQFARHMNRYWCVYLFACHTPLSWVLWYFNHNVILLILALLSTFFFSALLYNRALVSKKVKVQMPSSTSSARKIKEPILNATQSFDDPLWI